jgi:hypothetical protein
MIKFGKSYNSLSFHLLKTTFSIYLIVTIFMTGIQMYMAWIEAEKFLRQDLGELGNSTQKGITLALWDLDYDQVDTIAEGIIALPFVYGLEIKGQEKEKLYGVLGDITIKDKLIFKEEDESFDIGQISIFSSSQVVLNRNMDLKSL